MMMCYFWRDLITILIECQIFKEVQHIVDIS